MSFQPIRERDAKGALVAAGYEWVEFKDTPGIPFYLLTCAGVVAALLGLWVALVGDVTVGLPIIIGGTVLAWWSYRARKAYGEDRRALVFYADGTIAAPYGLAGGQAPGTLPIKVGGIGNVDLDVQFETPYITLATRHGHKFNVVEARGLDDDEGRLIYTQLVNALEEIRRAIPPRASWPTVDRA